MPMEFIYKHIKHCPDFSTLEIHSTILQTECHDMAVNIKNNWSVRKTTEARLMSALKLKGFHTDSKLAYDMAKMVLSGSKQKHKPFYIDDGKKTPRVWTPEQLSTIAFLREQIGFLKDEDYYFEEYFQRWNTFHFGIQFHLTLLEWIEAVPEDQRKVFHYRNKSKKSKKKILSASKFSFVTMFPLIAKRKIGISHILISSTHLKTCFQSCFSQETEDKLRKRANDKTVVLPGNSKS
jgi:hypothetical protein